MENLRDDKIHELEEMAYQIRIIALEMITNANWGHIGGSFSEAEILSCLYFHILHVDAMNPNNDSRDYFVLSKAHASPGLYAVLALKKYFQMKRIYTYCKLKGLDGHLDEDLIVKTAKKSGCIITLESGRIFWGFGSAVSECLIREYPVLVEIMGIEDHVVESASVRDLLQAYKLTPKDVYLRAKRAIKRK